jgi:DNA polymerase elongation subunit (family B)
MLQKLPLVNLVFLDVETVPQHADFKELDEEWQELWAKKTAYQRKDEFTPEEFYDRASIWAEFGKIICISVAYFNPEGNARQLRVASFYGEESELLKKFKTILEGHFAHPKYVLCAHNGKEFDFPYIARRMLIHGITLPEKLNLFGKKPWEIPHLDTMELWKFGDFKHFTSLKLLAKIFGIPSPKDEIDGSQVRDVYYNKADLERIIQYCEKDTITVAQLVLKMRGEALLERHEIITI